MGTRRALVAGVIVAALAAFLGWHARQDHVAPEPKIIVTDDHITIKNEPAPPPRPYLPAPTATEPARPQPVPLPEGANPPPLDGKRSEPAPPQKQFTAEETIARREADLKLLDDTKARLEEQLAAAKSANDAATVHELEIRIGRLTDLRKKRGDELDKLRAGGSAQP